MFGSDWANWQGPRARTPEPPVSRGAPIHAPPPASVAPRQLEDTLVYSEITFALGVSHCPWLKDRAENMERVRPILQPEIVKAGQLGPRAYHEETERAPNNVWSRKLWGWGVTQSVTHGVYLQDDLRIHPDFWNVIRAMVRAVPNRVIGLICNHPLSKRALQDGHTWLRMCETLGTGYIVPTAVMALYLDWYDRLPPAYVAANCEDFLFSRWLVETGRKSWHPIPTVIQTKDDIATSNPAVSYTFRKSYIDWTDPRVAGRDLTDPDYWKPKTLPPDFGYAVSQDTRYPPGPFSNEEVLEAHRGVDRLRLRVYPPAKAGLDEGLARILAGSYDEGLEGVVFEKPPTILDLGANVGSFTVRAAHRWLGARIVAYEPSSDNAEYCQKNVEGIAQLVQLAVVGADGPPEVLLREGKDNTGQRSIYQLGEQRDHGEMVKTIRGRELPPCDIFKADMEGCELEVLRDYLYLAGVRVLMIEWHRDEDYKLFLKWLPALGFRLFRDDTKGKRGPERNLIFVRERFDLPNFACPGSSVAMLAELRGYDLVSLPDMVAPTILDIGGHVGGFSWEALRRWPDGNAITFEPHPETFALLARNVEGMRVEPRNFAVVHPRTEAKMRLYEGVNGRHECSLRTDLVWAPDASDPTTHVSQRFDRWVDADTFDAEELPPCDVMKVDCEGGEIEILRAYKHLKTVRVLITEAHSVGGELSAQAQLIAEIAEAAGLKWIGPDKIVARFVRP